MKKAICLLLAILIGTCTCISNENASLQNCYQRKEKLKSSEDNYKYKFDIMGEFTGKVDEFECVNVCEKVETFECINSDYECANQSYQCEFIDTSKKKINTYSYVDNNENNDSFSTASVIYEIGEKKNCFPSTSTSFSATISKKSSGWGPWKKNYIDKDFYSYDVYTKGTIKVKLGNVPSDCDYDIRLYKMTNNKKTKISELDFDAYYRISANRGYGLSEKIETECEPGTYFIAVYSYGDMTYNNDKPYSLIIGQSTYNYMNELPEYNITKARNNGDYGAIWISDYNPLGYRPITISNPNALISFENYSDYPYIRHLADNYSNDSILYSEIFVWDVTVRACLYVTLTKILGTIESYSEWSDSQSKTLSLIMDATSLTLSIVGLGTSIISFSTIAAAALPLLANPATAVILATVSLAATIVSIGISHSEGEYSVSKSELREYLIDVRRAMEVGKNSTNMEVKTIKFRYKFKNKSTIDYSPKFLLEDNIYEKSTIPCNLSGSSITGSVKSFSSMEDIERILINA